MVDAHQLEPYPMCMIPTSDLTRGRQNPRHHHFYLRLRQARRAAGLSMAALCDQAEMGRATVSQLEARRGVPRLFTVERLADALKVSPGWLVYGIDAPWSSAPELRCKGLGSRIREMRAKKGLSLRQVADGAGISAPAVGLLESGSIPTIAGLEDIAVALDISPAWLGFGEGPRELPKRGQSSSLQHNLTGEGRSR